MRRSQISRGPIEDSRADLLDLLLLIYLLIIWGMIFLFYFTILLVKKTTIEN